MSFFREQLNRFKNGSASSEESSYIQNEIEKFEAISDYLSDQLDQDLPDFLPAEDDTVSVKKLSRSINFRLFRAVLLSVLLLLFAAGGIFAGCNLYFYNPNQGIEEKYGGDGQAFIDMQAFTELHAPGYTNFQVSARRNGPGSYQMRMHQSNLLKNEPKTSFVQIVRGKVRDGDKQAANDYLNLPVMNAFGYRQGILMREDEYGNAVSSPDPEHIAFQLSSLKELPRSALVGIYVTFSEDLSIEKFSHMYDDWNKSLTFYYAAVANHDDYIPSIIGFAPDTVQTILENSPSSQDYPNFQLNLNRDEPIQERATTWEQHFRSLVTYLRDRSAFTNTMTAVNGMDSAYYDTVLQYINDNGVNIYGAVIQGKASDVLAFLNQEQLSDFYVSNIRLSALASD